jgi:hypothetical protein
MTDHLRELLTPADDGRAFVDAVLLRASGALHRRRQAAETAPVLGWIGLWARPWLVAALLVLAVLGLLPALPAEPPAASVAEYPVLSSALPEDVAAITLAAAVQE